MNTTRSDTVRVGLVGCGNVSRRYLQNVASSDALRVLACADAAPAVATALGAEFGLDVMRSVDDLLRRDDIDLVLNLTIPAAHAAVSMAALRAGKHVYTEKPLAANLEDARRILSLASDLGLQVGCAPDTFMGAGMIACQQIIAEGAIGVPISANGFMMTQGPELFHPSPSFLYREGAGPLFDGGPYYLSALVSLLGPIASVAAVATVGRDERFVIIGEDAGTRFRVETPTHVASVIKFAGGAVGSLVTSFDVIETATPRLEIHGTEGSINVPAPNSWGGPVSVRRRGESAFSTLEIDDAGSGFMGMGLADMAEALAQGRTPRADGARGLHVLEVLEGIRRSATETQFYDITPVSEDVAKSFGRWNGL
jgi:predicted dehydrogenase